MGDQIKTTGYVDRIGRREIPCGGGGGGGPASPGMNETIRPYLGAIARLDEALQVRPHADGGYAVDLMTSEDGGLGLTHSMSEKAANRWRWIFLETFKKVLS